MTENPSTEKYAKEDYRDIPVATEIFQSPVLSTTTRFPPLFRYLLESLDKATPHEWWQPRIQASA